MKRNALKILQEWHNNPMRKPLVIRGARQVGKTWLVRHFAEVQNLQLVELNFEKNPGHAALFASNEPQEILTFLGASLNKSIDPLKTVLFLDEIQAFPQLLSKLRWFAEEMSRLTVIATGSLLEFVLTDHTFSMPVGRISYMHLEPLSFEEFLIAQEQIPLLEYIKMYDLKKEIPKPIHDKLMGFIKEYTIIGGMPAAVFAWIKTRSLQEVNRIHFDLLATYRDDFTKYRGRVSLEYLNDVLKAVPQQLGGRFVYSKVNPDQSSVQVKKAFDLLTKARVCHRAVSCAANGIPLGAELNNKYFKSLFLDTGLCSTSLGLALHHFQGVEELILINNGAIAEQIVGQSLRTLLPTYIEPELFYWQREKKGGNAEIDYIIQHETKVIPIEVKAGKTGSMKSLHLFMGLKKYQIAVRINSDYPSITQVDVINSLGEPTQYTLLSIPFYLISRLHQLLTQLDAGLN